VFDGALLTPGLGEGLVVNDMEELALGPREEDFMLSHDSSKYILTALSILSPDTSRKRLNISGVTLSPMKISKVS
jgi:hypothetical protein